MPANLELGVVPVGIVKLPWGVTPTQQTVIPRYYNGTLHPAGTLEGWGPESILRSDGTTQSLSSTPNEMRWIVLTEGWPVNLSAWQEQVAGRDPAHLQPIVRNFTIAGFPDVTGYDPTTSYINVRPNQQNISPLTPSLYGGFKGFGCGGIVDNVTFFYIPGTCLEISRPEDSGQINSLPHDRLKWRLSNLTFRRAFGGPNVDATDCSIYDCEANDIRDYGFALHTAVQFGGLHAWGVGHTGHASGGAGIWFPVEGGDCHGHSLYGENCPIGVRIDTAGNKIYGCFCHTNSVANVRIDGKHNQISGGELRTSPLGIWMTSPGGATNWITDTKIQLDDNAVGIKIDFAWIQQIRNVVIDGYKSDLDTQSNGTGIDINGAITFCNIQATIVNVTGPALDLSGATIADSDPSVIDITTDGTITWPSGQTWSTTPQARDYRIYINGDRWYRQSTP